MITLYHNVTHAPVIIDRLMRDELLVKRYKKPEQLPSSIIIPEVARHDRTQTLWEVILSNPAAEEELGIEIPVGSVVQTLRRFPRDTGLVDGDDEGCLLLSVSVCEVKGLIIYDEEETI